jgi:hypothetical protein
MKGKKVLGWVAAGGIAAGLILGGAVGYALQPEPTIVQITKEVEVIKEVPVEIIKEVNITVEVPTEDNEFLGLACDKLVYDDIAECKEEVEAEDVALALAWEKVDKRGFDFLEDEKIFADEDDLRWVKFYKDYDDIKVLKSDFDDGEYSFNLTAKVDDDTTDKKVKVAFVVDVEENKAELKSVKKI